MLAQLVRRYGRCVCFLLTIHITSLPFSTSRALAQSAQEILDKSTEAMKPPIQYRLRTAGLDTVVSQKRMPDGTIAMRTETSLPFKKVTLAFGDENFEAYPDHGVAINMRFLHQLVKDQAGLAAKALGTNPVKTASIKGEIARNGKPCIEIESRVSPQSLAAFRSVLSADILNAMSGLHRYVIERDSSLMVEFEILSASGSSVTKSEYKDIAPNATLSDELFLLPTGLDVQVPKSVVEYSAITAELIASSFRQSPRPFEPFGPDPPALPVGEAPRLGPVKIDPITGRATAPAPPWMTQTEFDRRTMPKTAVAPIIKISWVIVFATVPLLVYIGVVVARRLRSQKQ